MLDSNEAGPINLGNPVELTVLQIAELVRDFTGARSEIQFLALPQDDPTRRRPDITLARTKLGWQPRVLVEDGISRTIQWHTRNSRGELAS